MSTEDQKRDEELVAIVMTAADIEQVRAESRRAGYAEAVAHLRDNDLYRHWWYRPSVDGEKYWSERARAHLADYLEVVGPDGLDVTAPVAALEDQAGDEH